FIGTRNSVLMVTREKKVLFQHQISAEYQHAVRRLKNGHFVGIGASGRAVEIDEAGKEVAAFQLTDPSDRWGDIDGLGNGRYLVTNYGSGFVREVNAKGATLWQAEVPG